MLSLGQKESCILNCKLSFRWYLGCYVWWNLTRHYIYDWSAVSPLSQCPWLSLYLSSGSLTRSLAAAQFPVLADHLRWLFNADNKPWWREEEGEEQETTITHFLHNTYNAFKYISLCNALYGETVIFFSTQEWLNKTRNMRQTALELNVIHSTFL